MKRKAIFTSFIALILSFTITFGTVSAATTVNNLTFETGGDYTFNIKAVINGDSYQTSFDGSEDVPAYYNTFLQIDEGAEQNIKDIRNGVAKDVQFGIRVTHSFALSNNNKTLTLTYRIDNFNARAVNYRLATESDVNFAGNEKPALYKDGKERIIITQDDKEISETYGAQMVLTFPTEPSSTWIGSYTDLSENKYNNSEATNYISSDGVDTGMAWSWGGQIPAYNNVQKQVVFNLKLADEAQITIVNPDETKNEYTALKYAGFTFPEIVLSNMQGYDLSYNTKADGTGTEYDPNDSIFVSEDELTFYVIKTPIVYTINIDTDGAKEMESIKYTIEDDKVDIETPEKDGYIFKSWEVVEASGNWEENEKFTGNVSGKYGNITIKANYIKTINPPTGDNITKAILGAVLSSIGLSVISLKSIKRKD